MSPINLEKFELGPGKTLRLCRLACADEFPAALTAFYEKWYRFNQWDEERKAKALLEADAS